MLAGRVLSRVAQTSGRRMGHTSSEVPTFFYDNVWRKKTSLYAAWMFSGAAVLIFGGGAFGDFVWDSINSGVCLFCIF